MLRIRAGKDTSKRAIKPSKRLSTRSIPVVVHNSTSIKEYSFHSGVMYSLHDTIPPQVLSQRNKIPPFLSSFQGSVFTNAASFRFSPSFGASLILSEKTRACFRLPLFRCLADRRCQYLNRSTLGDKRRCTCRVGTCSHGNIVIDTQRHRCASAAFWLEVAQK